MKTKSMLHFAIIVLANLVFLPAVRGTTRLEWFDVSNSSALCNDFTRAGYFLRRVSVSDRWIIYLEGGGLCYSNETCNRRFFVPEVSSRFNRPFTSGANSFEIYYGNFDPAEAWNETVVSGREAAVDVVSPLMTSMRCYENKSDYFPQGLSVQGTDILDQDCEKNPLFCDYNHIVVPYCSSDLWLGSEVDGMRNSTAANTECTQCFNYDEQNGCFKYNPQSDNIQFTFRGNIIFMSVIRDLLAMGMNVASEVILVGSSAGGLGALNNAKWLHSELQSIGSAELSVIFDSAWFINFRGNIYRELDGTISRIESEAQRQNILTLLSIIESNEACRDVQLGFPCCSSPFCLLTQTNGAGESYYPKVLTFGIFSLYDVYLLAPSLNGLQTIQNEEEISIGYGIDFLLTVGEYGGEVNNTVALTEMQTTFFSYYATQCFQHVYLATSTLWGLPGASVFGRSSVELERELASFNHSIETGIWRTLQLAGITIQEALIQWYSNRTVPMQFRDSCGGPHCNSQCPERFLLAELDSNNWSPAGKLIIVVFVVGIATFCLLLKATFCIWLCWLNKFQKKYDEQTHKKENDYSETDGEGQSQSNHKEFEDEEEPINSLRCERLRYSVTSFREIKTRDEKEKDDSVRAPYRVLPDTGETPSPHSGENRFKRLFSLTEVKKRKEKKILKDVTTSFKSGQLSGIIGPSGCGKTTLLDLLTGRRRSSGGRIYIDGKPMEDMFEWYVTNTGYVLQLATPYYEELTVLENLTLAAILKLPEMGNVKNHQRVNEIMTATGIKNLAERRVGGATGLGLSGGQKRRLLLAMQLLTLPKIIFLDEPLRGLDAGSAYKLLKSLQDFAHSKRTVVLTVHRPGKDLFKLFDKIVLLDKGKIAYDGNRINMHKEFERAACKYLELPKLKEHEPYDIIQDVLNHHKILELLTDKFNPVTYIYDDTDGASNHGQRDRSTRSSRFIRQFRRLAALEARASKQATDSWWWLYFPLVFFVYGLLLGTVYLQQTNPIFIISGFAAYSFASSLVMFPMLHRYYIKALKDPVASSAPLNNTNVCFPERYTGNICRNALATRQKCISDRCGSTDIFVRTLASQESLESQVSSLLNRLQLLSPSSECAEVVGPFLCFYYFGLCDSSEELYLPSSGECETLTTETCAREFRIAVNFLGSANLPQCNTLSPTEIDCNGVCVEDEDSDCNATYGEIGSGLSDPKETNCTVRMVNNSDTVTELLVPYESESDSGPNSTESPMARPITCSQGFYLDNESCRAECSKWENLPHHVELTTRVVARLGAVVYIISASVLLVLSCVHRKRMFKFPSIFIVYEMFPLGLFEVFLLIAITDTEGLFCSKRDVIGSLEDSTVFCNIQGVVFHYIALQQTLLWLFHILVVFWTVKFPMQAKNFSNKHYFRYIHFIMLVLAVVLPCIPLAAVLGTGGSVLASFPPFQCFARNSDVTYYTFILPASIMMGVGIALIILILHILIHVTALRKNSSIKDQDLRTAEGSLCSQLCAQIKKLVKLHSAELKVLIISCYYVVFAVFIMTTFTITNVQNQTQFFSDITDNFACEATGTGKECDRPFAQLNGEIFTVLSLILVGLFPIVNLAYVVNIKELKQIGKCCQKYKRQLIRSNNAVTSFADTQRSNISSE